MPRLEHIVDEHNVLLERIPSLPDVQSAWASLLHCANARANYVLRVIRPELARHFAQAHDAGLWRCLCAILRVGEDQCDALAKDAASLPLCMGGLGLRSAVRTSSSAQWADSLSMVRERHPGVADMIVDALESDPATPILSAVVEAARAVQVGNFEPPSWASLSHGARPPPRELDEFEPGCSRRGWRWTPHWCRRTIVTGRPDLGRHTSMGQHLWWLGAARKEPIPSWSPSKPSQTCGAGWRGWRTVV